MSYNNIADMATDDNLLRRVTAAAYEEQLADAGVWAQGAMWEVAAQPGWSDAWGYAVAAGVDNIGRDESVITDGMILSAVQVLTR